MIVADASTGDVLVAIFSAVIAIVSIGIPAYLKARSANKKLDDHTAAQAEENARIRDTLGVKNGHGDIIQMLTTSLMNQGEMIAWTKSHDRADAERFEAVYKRLDSLESPGGETTE